MWRQPGRPPFAFLGRDGDGRGVVALTVSTEGEPPEGATALSGIVEARLSRRALLHRVVPSWDFVRASVLVTSPEEGALAADALVHALQDPLSPSEAGDARPKREALATRRLGTPELAVHARCRGEPFATVAATVPAELAEPRLEALRRSAAREGRVAFGAVGGPALRRAVEGVLARGPAWSKAPPLRFSLGGKGARSYPTDGAVVVHVALEAPTGPGASRAALALGAPRGALPALAAREGARIDGIFGVAHLGAGCIDLTLELPDGATPLQAARLAAWSLSEAQAALGVARTEDRPPPPPDARDAAEQAALFALSDDGEARSRPGSQVTLGLPRGRPAPLDLEGELSREAAPPPPMDLRARAEPGQSEAWMLVASPCAAEDEGAADAGLAAAAVTASAAAARSDDLSLEPWITPTAIGVLAHGAARPGEAGKAHLRRLADAAAFAMGGPPTSRAAAEARTRLFTSSATDEGRTRARLAHALSPGRPGRFLPTGTEASLARASDEAIRARARALAEGPLRAALLSPDLEASREVADALARYRLGGGHVPCAAGASPPLRGLLEVPRSAGAELYFATAIPSADTRGAVALDALASLLGPGLGHDGSLARRLEARATLIESHVVPFGDQRALIVRVGTRPSLVDEVLLASREVLGGIGRLPDPVLEAQLRRAEASATSEGMDPRRRLAALFAGRDLAAPRPRLTAAELRSAADRLFAATALTVVVGRPGAARP